jgi:hypothetical protein
MFPKSHVLSQSGGVLKVPLAKLGKWFHKAYGVVEFTREDFKAIIDNFRDNLLGHKPYLTFGHLQEDFSVDSHKKKGDMIGFAEESDTLYGLFKATEDAYKSVQSGEYEFSSGEFIRNFQDKDSGDIKGTLILRVALTNSPFIPNLDRVQAFSQSEKEEPTQVFTMKIDMTKETSNNTTPEVPNTEAVPTEQKMDKDFVEQVDKVDNPLTNDVASDTNLDNDKVAPKVDVKDEPTVVTPETLNSPEAPASAPIVAKEESVVPTAEDLSVSSVTKEAEDIKQSDESVSNPSPIKTPAPNMNTAPTATPVPNVQQGLSQAHLDIDTLIGDITNKLEKRYERTVNELSTLVKDLQTQLVAKQQDLEKVKSVTQAQAFSLSQAQQQVLTAQEKVTAEYLMGEGVSPALIQRFSQIREAIISNSQVIRLSDSEGQNEREISLIQALSDLVVDATNTPAINLSQEGTPYYRRHDSNGLLTIAEKTIRENRQRAQQMVKK